VVDKSDWFFVHFPIGLHAGWLCAASLVNINLAIKYDNGSVPLQVAGAILAIFFSAFFACLFELKFKDSAFLLANAWALYGISVNEDYRNGLLGSDISEGFFIVLNSVWIGLITLTIATFALNRFLKTRH
jgi:predicted tellurium resistance membrane protein TerC